MLVYRAAPGEEIPNVQRKFESHGGGIDILSRGKSFTAYGRHWSTSETFVWIARNESGSAPHWNRPEDAPAVTQVQVERFLEAVGRERAFASQAVWGGVGDATGLNGVADLATERATSSTPQWKVRDGKVVDGREAFLSRLVFLSARKNPGKRPEDVAAVAIATFKMQAAMTGRWSERFMQQQALAKARHLAQRVANGAVEFRAPVRESRSDARDRRSKAVERGIGRQG